ncbi:MAG: tetratricopeptide repeat protein [Nitrosomonas sp.]|uniref:tetratricopeptide repeat protein n=1 Tax=Pseudomonadati TaxID=3379134 RepID=UPI0027195D50|nr:MULTISPECIES: tetratricopeptide repeat protein [Bacteria]MDO8995737.1 tetratricopeptide repeat protein [Sediminibacterium sp.]MDP3664457.1 tetratricopeptide repeat protein [Nitrosomonas sp.]MDZ4104740.1 tetratricopeptide repeat protein [Nitrosomonas sp.]
MKPYFFTVPLHRFDLELLPLEARSIGSDKFKDAVVVYFATQYAEKGEAAIVTVDDNEIRVLSLPKSADPMDFVQELLQSGKIKEALPFLEALTDANSKDATVLYNLGIAYSELGRFEDAVMRLKKSLEYDPSNSNAWVGIGVAYNHLNRKADAKIALNKAVALDPANGYAHRNLGAALAMDDDYQHALPHFREACHQLPKDPQAIYGLGQCLLELNELKEADELFISLINQFPASPVTEFARQGRSQIAHKNLRGGGAAGGIRPDVMMYILGALETFKEAGAKKRQEITFEIAIKGQSGLDINDPAEKYTLKTLPGEFSGLHLLAIMHAGFKQIDPTVDSGADFDAEYEAAVQMFREQQ